MSSGSSDSAHFDAARALFAELCDVDAASREARLAGVAPELARLVRELLAADAAARGRARRATACARGESRPERIGGYEVLERLGAGGMGVVYRARQRSPERQVALKVVRSAAVSADGLRRFRHEAEALARLDHPGIARLIEAGTLDDGTGAEPWFALELVDGRPLTRFAREEGLDLRARLTLLIDVCDAVQHAHAKGVLHRDLKPANVLVTADGRPKVLDFGLARVTDGDAGVSTMHTHAGEVLGTLAYMSPEQLAGDPSAVDARADVYALGVVAYELLADAPPHDLVGRALHEAARVVSEDEPTSLGLVDRALRGDVETIVGKAMSKDAARRYGSVAELAGDLRRYLADEPIVARPPTLSYQLGKFARRNRAFVGGVAGVFLALVIGTVVSTLLYFEKERAASEASAGRLAAEEAGARERDAHAATTAALAREEQARVRAETARTEALDALALRTRVLEHFSDIFEAATPWQDGDELRVVDALDRAVERSRDAFADHPQTRAKLLSTFAATYAGLGLYDRARPLSEQALALIEASDSPLEATLARGRLGYLDAKLGDPGGVALLERSMQELEALAERDGASVARVERVRTAARLCEELQVRGRPAEAERWARRAIALAEGVDDPELGAPLLTAWKGLGDLLMGQGRRDEARAALERALELANAEPDGEMYAALILNSLAVLHAYAGEFDQALTLMDDVLARMRALGGDRHEFYATQLSNAATFHAMGGDDAGSIELFEQSLALRRELSPEPTRGEATTLNNLAEALRRTGRVERALSTAREALALHERFFGPTSERTGGAACNLGLALLDSGDYAAAAEQLARGVELRAAAGVDPVGLATTRTWLAEARLGARDFRGAASAAAQARAVLAPRRATPATRSPGRRCARPRRARSSANARGSRRCWPRRTRASTRRARASGSTGWRGASTARCAGWRATRPASRSARRRSRRCRSVSAQTMGARDAWRGSTRSRGSSPRARSPSEKSSAAVTASSTPASEALLGQAPSSPWKSCCGCRRPGAG
ncbi:MAG: serine/threonine protein kinase [Planctomycetes bacterium]|nr:serine/threonine protein kinase [Planctomycetota bacterium]